MDEHASPGSSRVQGGCAPQATNADLLLAENFNPCTRVLASKLNLSFVDYFPAGPYEPFFTSWWKGNRQAVWPNPLSYFPQHGMHATSQRLARLLPSPCLGHRQYPEAGPGRL